MVPLFLAIALAAQPAGDYQMDVPPNVWGRLNKRGPVWRADLGPFGYQMTGPAFNGPGTWRLAAPAGGVAWECKGWDGTGPGTFTLVAGGNPKTRVKIVVAPAP